MMVEVIYRHPTEADVPAMVEVVNLSQADVPIHHAYTVDEFLADTFRNDDFDPDGCWLAVLGGAVIGVGMALVKKNTLDVEKLKSELSIDVVPSQRGGSVAQELLELLLSYVRERGIRCADLGRLPDDSWLVPLARRLGFRPVRFFFRMMWRAGANLDVIPLPPGYDLRSSSFKMASDELLKSFTETINDAFLEHFNFVPLRLARVIQWRDATDKDSRLVLVEHEGECVGVCMGGEMAAPCVGAAGTAAYIMTIGVRKPYRHLGIGRSLLTESMAYFHSLGHERIYLDVDADNRKALGLYEKLGFETVFQESFYRLDLTKNDH